MFQRLTDRGDVDKEHIIELKSGKATSAGDMILKF